MRVFVLHKDCTDTPWEIAHLYEHWFIQSFFSYVEDQLGIDRGVIGYLGGETYKNDVFIEGWFYDDTVVKVFEDYIANETLIEDVLDVCVQQCATEDREDWQITNKRLLSRQLNQLRATSWLPDSQVPTSKFNTQKADIASPVSINKNAAAYRSLTVIVNLADATLEERAVFIRFGVIISDVIGRHNQQQGWYEHDTLAPRYDENGIFFIDSLTVRRGGLSNSQIAQQLECYLHDFDIKKNQQLVAAHFKVFANEPLWKGRIREDLQLRGIVVSNHGITKLATPERLQSIIQKLDVTVTTVDHAFAKNLHV